MQRIKISKASEYLGKSVKLAGWVNCYRDHGKLIFVDLRDRSGLIQIVLDQDIDQANKLRSEWVIEIVGEVKKRPENMLNKKVENGDIEIKVKELVVLSEAKTLPFSIKGDGKEIKEEERLKYRYLDLRRDRLKRNLIFRQKTLDFMREFLTERDFISVETPILTKSTPEGARDFLVPSRIYPGNFYALPQSPQQYKQLLMVAGLERYFQIARCFRDEDSRADRQPEFTQLDLEMSFVEQEDILKLVEKLMVDLIKDIFPEKKMTFTSFPRISYVDSIKKYKTDRPDLRKNKDDDEELAFSFIIDFPMFEKQSSQEGWTTMHHPFTRLQEDDCSKIKKSPGEMKAFQYDLALNGHEIGGGSLRSHRPEMLKTVFAILGHEANDIERKFNHLLTAFEYGVPPHGGIAIGLDRLLAILLGEKSIREVIAFPKTGDARSLMMNTPSVVEKKQLTELSLEIRKKDDAEK